MILLAIDPGLEKTGYALFEKSSEAKISYQFLTSGLIVTSKNLLKEERLLNIYESLLKLINDFHPQKIVFENIFYFKNQKTIVPVSQAQGVILLLAGQKKIPLEYLSPLNIKQIITGYGRADKKAIKKMIDLTLKLPKKPADDNEYDAIACGLAYCFQNFKLLK
jgi:crossover junction endodeoxyribonuclease RuvC